MRYRCALILPFLFLVSSFGQNPDVPEDSKPQPWKMDLQILLGFTGEDVDGVLGRITFTSLQKFAKRNGITDVVLRGEYDDLGFWGFQIYLVKYHKYWMRELKNRRIIDDVLNKEYIRQADDALYAFEIAIQEAQEEVDRLQRAKLKAKRLAEEKLETEKWEVEKKEAERLVIELNQAILEAEVEAEKWELERTRARRLAEEQKQFEKLASRKAEATRLTRELEDVIFGAKGEIDRLVEENHRMLDLIEKSYKTESLAEELSVELGAAIEQMELLIIKNDSLEIKLELARIEIAGLALPQIKKDSKRNWKWLKKTGFKINFETQAQFDDSFKKLSGNPAINLGINYPLPFNPSLFNKTFDFFARLVYSPEISSGDTSSQYYELSIESQVQLINSLPLAINLGIAQGRIIGIDDDYITWTGTLSYQLPFEIKSIRLHIYLKEKYFMKRPYFIEENSYAFLSLGLRAALN